MGNVLDSNPYLVDTAATLWTKTPKAVRLIQWVDDNADIPDDGTITLTINGVALVMKVQRVTAPPSDGIGVVWQMGPFNPGIIISDFIVTTMATGNLHVWLD